MTPQEYRSLYEQVQRQQPELDALDAEIAGAQGAIDALQQAVDTAQADVDDAQAALDAHLALPEQEQDEQELAQLRAQLESDRASLLAAREALSGPADAQRKRQAKAEAMRQAIAQCQDAMQSEAAPPSETDLQTLQMKEAQDRAWDRIQARRDALQVAGLPVSGQWFHNDVKSRSQWERMVNRAELLGLSDEAMYLIGGQPVPWKTMAKTYVVLTAGKIREVVLAMEQREALIFGVAEQHRIAMLQAPDPGSYDFSGGWPATYGE